MYLFADVCELPKETGECRGYFPSWFYDKTLGRCQQFIYGGCAGNKNRFETVEECQNRCVPPTKKAVEPTVEAVTGNGQSCLILSIHIHELFLVVYYQSTWYFA